MGDEPKDPPRKPWEYVDDLVRDQAAREIATAEARREQLRPRTSLRYTLPLVALLAALAAWLGLRPTTPPEVLTPREQDASQRLTIYLTAQAVQHYRDSTGVLPPSLGPLGLAEDGVAYEPRDSAYVLRVTATLHVLEYRSGDDLAPFAAADTILRNFQERR